MGIGDYITIGIIVVALTAIIIYLICQKKKGVKCIGCPHGNSCTSCNCDCGSNNKTE